MSKRWVLQPAAALLAFMINLPSVSAQSVFPVMTGGDSGDACGMKVRLKPQQEITIWNGPWNLFPEMDKLSGEEYLYLCWPAPRPSETSGRWLGVVYTRQQDNDCGVMRHMPGLVAYVPPAYDEAQRCGYGWAKAEDVEGEKVLLLGE